MAVNPFVCVGKKRIDPLATMLLQRGTNAFCTEKPSSGTEKNAKPGHQLRSGRGQHPGGPPLAPAHDHRGRPVVVAM